MLIEDAVRGFVTGPFLSLRSSSRTLRSRGRQGRGAPLRGAAPDTCAASLTAAPLRVTVSYAEGQVCPSAIQHFGLMGAGQLPTNSAEEAFKCVAHEMATNKSA